MRLFSSLCCETSKCWTFTPHKHCIPCGLHVERKSFFVCPSVYLVLPFLQSALSFSVYCKAFHSDSLFVVASADVFQPPVRYWLKCSAWCEGRGERAAIQRHSGWWRSKYWLHLKWQDWGGPLWHVIPIAANRQCAGRRSSVDWFLWSWMAWDPWISGPSHAAWK